MMQRMSSKQYSDPLRRLLAMVDDPCLLWKLVEARQGRIRDIQKPSGIQLLLCSIFTGQTVRVLRLFAVCYACGHLTWGSGGPETLRLP